MPKDKEIKDKNEVSVVEAAGALAVLDNLPAPIASAEEIAAISGATFLARLQLITSRSPAVDDGFPVNNYALIQNKKHTPIGEQVDIMPLSYRPLAMSTKSDDPVFCYTPKYAPGSDPPEPTGLFAELMAQSKVKDSGCMFGTDFLVYIPSQKCLATFFMGSATARRDAESLVARCVPKKLPTTLTVKKVTSKKYPPWMSPDILPCSSPFDIEFSHDALVKAITDFNTPKEKEVAEVAEGAERER